MDEVAIPVYPLRMSRSCRSREMACSSKGNEEATIGGPKKRYSRASLIKWVYRKEILASRGYAVWSEKGE